MKTLLFFRKIVLILSCFVITSLHAGKKNTQKPLITLYEIMNHIKNANTPYLHHKKFYPLWKKLEHIARKTDWGIYSRQTIENFIRYCNKFKNNLRKKSPEAIAHINVIALINLIHDDLKRSIAPKKEDEHPLKTCSICQETINPTKELYLDFKCCADATFHENCIIHWFAKHQHKHHDAYQKCPLCRTTFAEYMQFLMKKTNLYKKLHEKNLITVGREQVIQEMKELLCGLEIYYQHEDALDSNQIDDTLSLDSDEFETLAEYYILSEMNVHPSI